MFARWCISVFIFSLTLFGVVSQQQLEVANQEIVLQFQNTERTPQETEYTLVNLKRQLQELGAKNIKVHTQGGSKLKITYYSTINVVQIKETLARTSALNFQHSNTNKGTGSFPINNTNTKYNIKVYEIQLNTTSGWDLDGTTVIVLDLKTNRFLNSNHIFVGGLLNVYQYHITTLTYKIGENTALHITNTLHTIPEVRAGPSC